MRNIKLTLSYDGTDFHGWQRQNGLRTVQEVLEDALYQLTGAGRRRPPVDVPMLVCTHWDRSFIS